MIRILIDFIYLNSFHITFLILINLIFSLDCLNDFDCAFGASCTAGVCGCNAETPVLVGDSASDIADLCVECVSGNSGSCSSIQVCDVSSAVCVGM